MLQVIGKVVRRPELADCSLRQLVDAVRDDPGFTSIVVLCLNDIPPNEGSTSQHQSEWGQKSDLPGLG